MVALHKPDSKAEGSTQLLALENAAQCLLDDDSDKEKPHILGSVVYEVRSHLKSKRIPLYS
jgi:hypothetical protein